VETVKQKSEEIVNIYKEDLSEFSKTIVQDTTVVVQEKLADLQMGDAVKQDRRSKSASRNQNQHQARISLLQKDPHTYTDAPNDPTFEEWASTFNIGAYTETITHLLTSNESVREFHTRLVPAQVSYRDFWCRYYYRLHILDQEEQRRAALVKSTIESNEDDDFNWDDEDDSKTSEKGEESASVSTAGESTKVPYTTESNTEAEQEKTDGLTTKETESEQQTTKKAQEKHKKGQETVKVDEPASTNAYDSTAQTKEAISVTGEPEVNNAQDDIDREIEHKYLQIQSSPTGHDKLSPSEEDEWGAWE